jgi:hypothetical protein
MNPAPGETDTAVVPGSNLGCLYNLLWGGSRSDGSEFFKKSNLKL